MPYDLRQHMVMDSTRIRNELGYSEPVTTAEGLQRVIAWELRAQAGGGNDNDAFDSAF